MEGKKFNKTRSYIVVDNEFIVDASIAFVKSKVGEGSTFKIMLPDEKVSGEQSNWLMSDSMIDYRLIETIKIELSDIYSKLG